MRTIETFKDSTAILAEPDELVRVFREDGHPVDVDDDDPDWRTATFEPGDVVVFGSLTVHGALPNASDRVRLSVDYRYQNASEPISAPSLGPHFAIHPHMPPLEELSRGW